MKVIGAPEKNSITVKTSDKTDLKKAFKWWDASSDDELVKQLLSTAAYIKENQNYRYRQTAVYARLYGNMSMFNFVGSNLSKMDQMTGLPADRPTFNLVQAAVDTLVSRISQSRPSPVFLTDNGNYKERTLAKKLNNFISGELYRTDAYKKATIMLRDALVTGMGVLKIFETADHKVGIDRVLLTELLVDSSDGMYGEPRTMYHMKLVDRDVLADITKKKKIVEKADKAYPDNSSESTKSVADQVLVIEGWRLPSTPTSKDGRHVIACSSGIILDEVYTKSKFPFVFLPYSERLLGFWAQGLAEQLMGTQMEINALLFTISRAIKLVGVPRVFVEEGSKVSGSAFNNDIGTIIKYRGVKPIYEVAQAVPAELYAQLQRLIDYGFQQSGVSMMSATSQKPAGLNSGEAIRSYDDISTDRFASLDRKYNDCFIELAYQIFDKAKEIAKEQGSYTTIYPGKDATKQIDLPKVSELDNPYVIQCFNMSSLPKDPAGRMQKVAEMIQSGMVSIQEGRRLLDFPDIQQMDKLANASEERIFQVLDKIIDEGEYTQPDPFMNLALAEELVVQYYNLYIPAKLEEEKAEMLRTFFEQVQGLKAAATPPAPAPGMAPGPGGAPNTPQALPQQLPTSDLVPNAVG